MGYLPSVLISHVYKPSEFCAWPISNWLLGKLITQLIRFILSEIYKIKEK